ncbi:hypothetical protein ABZX34_30235 [Streptomyces sp. NPDC004362]|uniref:hypothetical protein n=1 Tax=Streptomyces sp. NPDC004362 TaxID=3154456 RepID=UPI0033B711AD
MSHLLPRLRGEVGAPPDGQYRAFQRDGELRSVLIGVGLGRPVQLEHRVVAARFFETSGVFVLVDVRVRTRVPHDPPHEVRPEGAFPAGDQQFGVVRQAEERAMPAGAGA